MIFRISSYELAKRPWLRQCLGVISSQRKGTFSMHPLPQTSDLHIASARKYLEAIEAKSTAPAHIRVLRNLRQKAILLACLGLQSIDALGVCSGWDVALSTFPPPNPLHRARNPSVSFPPSVSTSHPPTSNVYLDLHQQPLESGSHPALRPRGPSPRNTRATQITSNTHAEAAMMNGLLLNRRIPSFSEHPGGFRHLLRCSVKGPFHRRLLDFLDITFGR
ncbi:hypothetical protein PMIN06_006999 [Paraphaeosphaeria minitans]